MRIVFLGEQYPPVIWDGAGTYVHDIAHALVDKGHEVHLVCAQGKRVVDEVDSGVHIHRRPLLRVPVSRIGGQVGRLLAGSHYPRDAITLRMSLTASYAIWLRRLRLRPDVIETPDGETRALLNAWRHSTALVVHLHTPTMFDLRIRPEGLTVKGKVADRLDRFTSDHADALTSPSDLLVDALRGFGWLRDREVDVIPYPFDARPYAGAPPVTATGTQVLAVGRLEWRKGLDVLLDAAARLGRDGTDVKVVMAGSPAGEIHGEPAGAWLRRRAEELGVACQFTGHVSKDELRDLYAQSRVVVVPSRFESFSIAALEGMASGRPVVTTAKTGVATWVKRWDGGTVIPPEDPDALAAALKPYLDSPEHAATVGELGRIGTAELAPDVIADRRLAVYQRAIDAHQRRVALSGHGQLSA